jgi:hypothetical protein
MNCSRCDALMVACRFEDVESTTSRESFPGWQCLHCGEVIDPGSAANRNRHQTRVVYPARPRYSTVLAEPSGLPKPKPKPENMSHARRFTAWKRWIPNPFRWLERGLSQ